MTKHLILAVAITIIGSSSIMAQQTQKFTAAKHNEYGLVYSLPITHFDIEVTALKTINKAGPYNKYAKKYLGTDNVITENSETWKLQSVNISQYGVPDKENQYLMQFKSGSTPFLILDSAGLPLAINIEQKETQNTEKQGTKSNPTILESNVFTQALSGELLASGSQAKQAEIAANQIYKIRESRTNLITGEADQMPPDGEAMKLTIAQLDAQEAALTALFFGTTRTETNVRHFDYIPTDEVANEVIFRISDFNGIVDKNDLSGEPVYLNLKVTQAGTIPVNEKGEEKKLPKGAVMYKIPGKAQVTLKYDGRQVFEKSMEVAQLGIDFGLDPTMFTDKKLPSYVIFNPQTGAIKEIGNAPTISDK